MRAGVLPKLALQYRRHGSPWLTCEMRPSGGPLWNLAAEFARLEGRGEDLERISAIAGAFNARSASIASVAASLDGVGGKSLCLLVDQFEELFRYEKDVSRDEAELFVDLVGRAATEEGSEAAAGGVDLHVIVTMRSEFLGECARFAGFAETINRTQYLVPRMDDDGLMRAVRRPAQMFGGEFDERLAERLIASVRGREDELPLLQHGLMLMWDDAVQRAAGQGGPVALDGAVVDKARGLAELLSRHADQVMASAAPDERRKQIVEAVFRALTDVNSEGSANRRPLPFRKLCAVTGATPDELRPILDAFRAPGVTFLTRYAPKPIEDKTPIDISHEALIRCWRRVSAKENGWLQEEIRDGLAWRTLLYQAEAFANDKSSYLSAPATETRAKWLTERNEAWAERYGGGWPKVSALIDASREHLDREAAREEANRQREIDIERLRAEAAEKSEQLAKKSELLARRRAQLALVSVGAAILTAAFSIWSLIFKYQERIGTYQAAIEAYRQSNATALATTQESVLRAGNSFKECRDCPEMVVVAAGRFTMGSPEGQGYPSERPAHEVTIGRPFAVAKFELTFDEWDACAAAHGDCNSHVSDSGTGDQRELGRCANLRQMAIGNYGQELSAALGGGVRIRRARRNRDQISVGRRHQARWKGDGQLRRLRQPMGRQADGGGRLVPREPVWSLRHGRQRLGVDAGLLEPQLPRSAG